MYEYKDYSYIVYIKGLPYDEVLEILNLALKRKVDRFKKIEDDRLWQAYLNRSENEGCTFDEFKKSLVKVKSNKNVNEIKDNSNKLLERMAIEDRKIIQKINVVVKE